MSKLPDRVWITFCYKDFKRHPKQKGSSVYIGDANDGPIDSHGEYINKELVDELTQLVKRAQEIIDPCYPAVPEQWQKDAERILEGLNDICKREKPNTLP